MTTAKYDAAMLALTQAELMELLYEQHAAASDLGRSRIRSRFKSLLKADVFDQHKPQHGKRQKYTIDQICQSIMYFSLADFGVDAWTAREIHEEIREWSIYVSKTMQSRIQKKKWKEDIFAGFKLRIVGSAVGEIPIISAIRTENGACLLDFPYMNSTKTYQALGTGACLINLEVKAIWLAETYFRGHVASYLASKTKSSTS